MKERPIEWRPLCAIARLTWTADPAQTLGEWAEAIKVELIRQGWTYPQDPEAITRAMEAVGMAWVKRFGPRPVRHPSSPSSRLEANWRGPLTAAESRQALRAVASWRRPLTTCDGPSPPGDSTNSSVSLHGRRAWTSLDAVTGGEDDGAPVDLPKRP